MKYLDFYDQERQRYLDTCTRCGLCAKACPILPYTGLSEVSGRDIQRDVFDYITRGVPNERAYTKAFACMECFKCTTGVCPEGLNPLTVNEIIKEAYRFRGLAAGDMADPKASDSTHRVMARAQVSASDYRRITRPSEKRQARYVFFPGCNVYLQPDKLLSALDIMDAIGDDYAFLPGLDSCCGDSFIFMGGIEEGCRRAEALVAAIAAYKPDAVVLWCPTCLCRFDSTIAGAVDLPFATISFPRYLVDNMHKLSLTGAAAGTVTLHEACKSAYTGLDVNGAREVLARLPGVTLREMAHHGRETMCCGSGAMTWFPESCARFRRDRLQEAAATGAERLVTVCHYCHQTFLDDPAQHDFEIINYVTLVAEAMGGLCSSLDRRKKGPKNE